MTDTIEAVATSMINTSREKQGFPTVASLDGFADEDKQFWLDNAKAAIEAMQIREMTVEEVADIVGSVDIDTGTDLSGLPITLRFTPVGAIRLAKALAKLGTIRIKGDV